jgi:hypothetical protein
VRGIGVGCKGKLSFNSKINLRSLSNNYVKYILSFPSMLFATTVNKRPVYSNKYNFLDTVIVMATYTRNVNPRFLHF